MRVFLVGLTIVAAAVGGGIGYAAMQTPGDSLWPTAGALQEEPTAIQREQAQREQSPTSIVDTRQDLPAQTAPSAETSAQTPSPNPAPTVAANDVVITESELNAMVTEAIATQPYTAPILDIAKDVSTTIENGRIESGMVMNIKDIPVESLPVEGQQAIEQLTRTFPFLVNRDVYLGIEGSPQIKDGAFSLDDTNIRFGQLKLPVANVASQLGISQTDIEQQIAAVLEQQGLTPDNIQVSDGQLVITGLPQ